ncbi:replication protein C, IncQ-type [Cupriavidus sp. TMH.W2]|uniref:replication protein C, IncQ-type n=1 Tax=Cupriavidus sp. TMH.W2 TaxID=3434465 RepID=UPI003D76F365
MIRRLSGKRVVRYDPMLPSAGLFGSFLSGERPKLDVECEFASVKWHLRGPDMLGVAEQTVLLVLMELAHEQYGNGCALNVDWQPLVRSIGAQDMAEVGQSSSEGRPVALAGLSVSYGELVRRCGRRDDGGSAARQLRMQLRRLCEVSVWFEQPKGVERRSQLLQWRVGDAHGVDVVLNSRLTEILLGNQYSPVSLAERLRLESDIARALHCALSVHIRPGETRAYAVDELAAFVWLGSEIADSTKRRRRQQLRKALAEIARLTGWTLKPHAGATLDQAVNLTFYRNKLAYVPGAGSQLKSVSEFDDEPHHSSTREEEDDSSGPLDISSWFTTPKS